MSEQSKVILASQRAPRVGASGAAAEHRNGSVVSVNQWTQRAACAGVDVNLFFPEARQSPSPEAKAFCASCPVSNECLEYAIEHRLSGVWGGTSETQRIVMRRMRKAS